MQIFARSHISRRLPPNLVIALALALACAAPGDPAGPSTPSGGPTPSLTITPAAVSLNPGDSARFTAILHSGSPGDTTVVAATWGATGGSIDAQGGFIAGSTAGTWVVLAVDSGTGLADTAQVAIADTSTHLPAPSLTVLPDTITLNPGDSASFTAFRHSGLPGDSTAVSPAWATSGGTISPQGRFAAGASAGTWYVVATTRAPDSPTAPA